MRRPFTLPLVLALIATAAAEPAWPPLSGEVSGSVTLQLLEGAPPLAWQVKVRPDTGAGVALELTTTAPGLAVKLEAMPPAGEAMGTWRVVSGTVEVASWWRVAAAQVKAAAVPPDLELGGALEVTGEGTWRGSEFAGTIHAKLTAGTARSAAQKWETGGVTLTIIAELKSGSVTLRSVELRAETAQVAGIMARNLRLEADPADGGRLAVRGAQLEALDGRVAITPFTLDPAAPAVQTTAEVSGVALEQLALLLPQALSEARGRAEGQIAFGWDATHGLSFGDGWLKLVDGTPASVKLAPMPGLITGQLPASNPARAALSRVELGQTAINLRLLHAEFHPAGDGAGRTATLKLEGEPVDPQLIAPLVIDVNVAGPLDQLVRLGFDDRMKVKGGP